MAGPPAGAGSILTLTRASRGHPVPDLPGSRGAQPRAAVLPPDQGRPHPQLCRVGRGCNRCAASQFPHRLPCRYLQRRPPRPNGARAVASRARLTLAWFRQKLTPASRARGAAPSEQPMSPAPTPYATPARAQLRVLRHFLVPPSRRPPGPARPRPRLSGQPERRPPRKTGVRRAAAPGLGPRGPGSS
ncbi:hypothetical protein NN561_004589 [Cricetulus griseus]